MRLERNSTKPQYRTTTTTTKPQYTTTAAKPYPTRLGQLNGSHDTIQFN